ncbi:MAG: hypothetical protein ABSG59_18800 [Verrucomicrobiota bacterium]
MLPLRGEISGDLASAARYFFSRRQRRLSLVAEEKEQRIEVDGAERLLAEFDAELLRQAMVNLIQNAIRYGPRGKAIRV